MREKKLAMRASGSDRVSEDLLTMTCSDGSPPSSTTRRRRSASAGSTSIAQATAVLRSEPGSVGVIAPASMWPSWGRPCGPPGSSTGRSAPITGRRPPGRRRGTRADRRRGARCPDRAAAALRRADPRRLGPHRRPCRRPAAGASRRGRTEVRDSRQPIASIPCLDLRRQQRGQLRLHRGVATPPTRSATSLAACPASCRCRTATRTPN